MISDPIMDWLYNRHPGIFIWVCDKKYRLVLRLEDLANWIQRM